MTDRRAGSALPSPLEPTSQQLADVLEAMRKRGYDVEPTRQVLDRHPETRGPFYRLWRVFTGRLG